MRIFVNLSFQICNSSEEFLVGVRYGGAGGKFWDGMMRGANISGFWLVTALDSRMIQIYYVFV